MGRFTKTNQSILKDKTVDWENNQSMGGDGIADDSGHRITNASTGSASSDYIIKDQIDTHIADVDPHTGYAEIADEPPLSAYSPDHTHDPPYEYAPNTHDHYDITSTTNGNYQLEDFIMKWGRSDKCIISNTVSRYNGVDTGSGGGILSQIVYFDEPFPTKCSHIQLFIEGEDSQFYNSQIQVGLVNIVQNGSYKDAGFRFDARKIMGDGKYFSANTLDEFRVKYIAIGH